MAAGLKRGAKRVLLALLIVAAFVAALLLYASGPGSLKTTGIYPLPEEVRPLSPQTEKPEVPAPPLRFRYRVLSWNIAYGHGLGSDGSDYAPKKPHEIEKRIRAIGAAIRSHSPDFALLQEVDRDSSRSGGVDQPALLRETSGLAHSAFAPSWEARYVPFPYWPPSRHFGKVTSGGLVLSRYPIEFQWVTLLPKPRKQPFWYRMFYLHRYLQRVTVTLPNRKIAYVWNLHLDAYDRENRREQVGWLHFALSHKSLASPVVIGGDFNATPPEARKHSDFPDAGDDYAGDETIRLVRSFPGLKEAVDPDEIARNEEKWFTFPADRPNRMLDHVFVPAGARVLDARVSAAGTLSDHLPLFIEAETVID